MCGVCGVYNFVKRKPIDKRILEKMTSVLSHRGPDDEGYYVEEEIGLGHRRLSIIDLAGGHQPMSNEDGSVWIVFNGEIYNYPELHKTLISKGHKFKTKSDTETIIHLYEEKGENCVDDLRGMFAFALWDSKKKKLILARDRAGQKPLYYYIDNEKVIFASEIKSILQDNSVSRKVNYEALDSYLSFACIPAPMTIFQNIYALPPAHMLICTPQKREVREYWSLHFSDDAHYPETYYITRLDELLHEAVSMRLISDVPLGAFLSGGIDSSAIVYNMSVAQNEPVLTNSIGFNEEKFNELGHAEIVAKKFTTNHHEFVVKPKALDILPKLVWHFDEPFADSSAIPTFYVSQMTRKNVTVALSGDGGDELFAGYQRRYYLNRLESRLRNLLPIFVRKNIVGPLSAIYPKADWLPRALRFKYFLANLPCSFEEAYFNDMSTFLTDMKEKLYHQDFKEVLDGYTPYHIFESYFRETNTNDSLSKVLYVDTRTYLPNDLLVKVDRMSMANSLEVRSPFLDHKLMEFVATIPSDLKLKGKISKYILKKSLEGKLPQEILTRKKMGFSIPLSSWLRNELRDFTEDILFSNVAKSRGYFCYDYIEKMWSEHLKGLRDFSENLWALLMLELWHRTFIDKIPVAP